MAPPSFHWKVVDVQYMFLPITYPTRFYIFKDTTSLLIILSYANSYYLGILKFRVPNKAPTTRIESYNTQDIKNISLSRPPPSQHH